MTNLAQYRFSESLAPLEFGARGTSVACTPAAIDLAAIGLAAAGFGYFAAKAYYHGHFEGKDELLDSGAAQQEVLSASELLSARTNELRRR